MTVIKVFASNLSGRHLKASARNAVHNNGAEMGVGVGRTGTAYALPVECVRRRPLSLERIRAYVRELMDYARQHPELTFNVARLELECDYHTIADLAPLFRYAPANVQLPAEWKNDST